jgi:hypothetical protein
MYCSLRSNLAIFKWNANSIIIIHRK